MMSDLAKLMGHFYGGPKVPPRLPPVSVRFRAWLKGAAAVACQRCGAVVVSFVGAPDMTTATTHCTGLTAARYRLSGATSGECVGRDPGGRRIYKVAIPTPVRLGWEQSAAGVMENDLRKWICADCVSGVRNQSRTSKE